MAASCLLLSSVLAVGATETFEIIGDVTPSKEAYTVDFIKGYNNFLSNKKEIDLSPGKRYYMTYTVEEVTENKLMQNGMVITQDNTGTYPYTKGMMKYKSTSDLLFEEGYTYFYRVEVTEEGFDYLVAKVSEKDSCWIELPVKYGTINEDCKYFGIWMAGSGAESITATLSAVLCYDEDGNDLGVSIRGAGNVSSYRTNVFNAKESDHYYEFSLEDAANVTISSERATEEKVVYMSYTTENVKKNTATKAGMAYTKDPSGTAPHASGNGRLNFNSCTGSPLVSEGAQYLIRVEVIDETVQTIVRKTLKGKVDTFSFSAQYGQFNKEAKYFAWWFGDTSDAILTANFKNFRCYDENGNNLGVKLNDAHRTVKIEHFGNLEDYTYCEGVYYCKANDTFIILDDECNAGTLVDEEGQETQWGTYAVNGTNLTLSLNKQETVYEYFYEHMTDKEGNRYEKLGNRIVEFVTGQEENKGNQIVEVTAKSKYKVKEPEEPVVEAFTFDAWCLRDGTEYNFDEVVTESLTLYARYIDGNGHQYLSVNGMDDNIALIRTVIIIATSVLLLAITTVGTVLLIKKGKKKHAK